MSRKKPTRRESTPEAFQRRLKSRFEKADEAVAAEGGDAALESSAPASSKSKERASREERTLPSKVPRRNFTLDPESDELLEEQVIRFARLGLVRNRSEIIRGALRALAGLVDKEASGVIQSITPLKRGARPKR